MESLELKIITPMEPGALPEIQWNIEEAKAYTLKKAKEYQSIAYTDADAAAMKKDRAQINKFITAVENERKRAKAFYNEPYEKFNAQVKEVLQPMRDTIQIIDQGLDELEQKYRDGKTDLCRKYYDRHIGDLKGLLPFERTIREEYYKRAFTPGKLEQAYMDFFGRIREDLKALDELPERFRDKAALEYMKSFSLSDALREGKRLAPKDRLARALKFAVPARKLLLAFDQRRKLIGRLDIRAVGRRIPALGKIGAKAPLKFPRKHPKQTFPRLPLNRLIRRADARVVVFDRGRQVAGEDLPAVMVKRIEDAPALVERTAEPRSANGDQRMGQHRRLEGVFAERLGPQAPHQPPSADVFHSGKHCKKTAQNNHLVIVKKKAV